MQLYRRSNQAIREQKAGKFQRVWRGKNGLMVSLGMMILWRSLRNEWLDSHVFARRCA